MLATAHLFTEVWNKSEVMANKKAAEAGDKYQVGQNIAKKAAELYGRPGKRTKRLGAAMTSAMIKKGVI